MDAKSQQRGSEPVKRLKLGGLYAEGNSAQLHVSVPLLLWFVSVRFRFASPVVLGT
jgi:hypothetical protein